MNSISNDKIRKISYDIIRPYVNEAKKEDISFASKTEYYGYFNSDILCGFAGLLKYKNKIIFKSIYVKKEYRKNGIFKALLNEMILLAINFGYVTGEATCTEMSIREFKKYGFKPITYYQKFIKVQNEDLSK